MIMAMGNFTDELSTEVIEEKLLLVPLCPPQIPSELA
jgi:hypothetical protein